MTTGGKTRDAIAAELEAEVFSGRLAPGDRLLSERDLAERHGVSRPIVREALRILAERGLVEITPGRGTYVRGHSPLAGTRPLELMYRRGHATARELSEARLMLESESAALAALRADLEDVRRLEVRLAALESATTPESTVAADLAFHLAVAAASHNRIVEAMLASLATLSAKLMLRSLGDPDVYRRSAPYHRLVHEAIARRDPEAARTAMRDHLGMASVTYGSDYDQDLDAMAQRALRRLGSQQTLGAFLERVIPVDTPRPRG